MNSKRSDIFNMETGFSLMEVMVGAAILTVLILVLVQGFYNGAFVDISLWRKMKAMRLASSNLDRAVQLLSNNFEELAGPKDPEKNQYCDPDSLSCTHVDVTNDSRFFKPKEKFITGVEISITPIFVMGEVASKMIESKITWNDESYNSHAVSYTTAIYYIETNNQ